MLTQRGNWNSRHTDLSDPQRKFEQHPFKYDLRGQGHRSGTIYSMTARGIPSSNCTVTELLVYADGSGMMRVNGEPIWKRTRDIDAIIAHFNIRTPDGLGG